MKINKMKTDDELTEREREGRWKKGWRVKLRKRKGVEVV